MQKETEPIGRTNRARSLSFHLIFQKIKRNHGKINVIPSNSERYISFDVGRLKFLDSMQFLSHGLNKLAEELSSDQLKYLKAAYPEHWKLLSKKGIYCSDCMNNMERFDETSLPSKQNFLASYMSSMYRRSNINTLEMCERH